MDDTPLYLVAGQKPWSRIVYTDHLVQLPGRWQYVHTPEELTLDALTRLNPRFIFFLHWSNIVPKEVTEGFECVCFHMTDVPFGRGGSPLQNLIARGIRNTMVTALRMTTSLDAGPVYGKLPLSLEGGAEEIYLRAGMLSAQLIQTIITQEPKPAPQSGEPVFFCRRTPAQSEITNPESLLEIHDMIRMLDAEGYPSAFICKEGFRFEFKRSTLYTNAIEATVRITRIDGDG
jgi:methionyl-tRNA formyltransferase